MQSCTWDKSCDTSKLKLGNVISGNIHSTSVQTRLFYILYIISITSRIYWYAMATLLPLYFAIVPGCWRQLHDEVAQPGVARQGFGCRHGGFILNGCALWTQNIWETIRNPAMMMMMISINLIWLGTWLPGQAHSPANAETYHEPSDLRSYFTWKGPTGCRKLDLFNQAANDCVLLGSLSACRNHSPPQKKIWKMQTNTSYDDYW